MRQGKVRYASLQGTAVQGTVLREVRCVFVLSQVCRCRCRQAGVSLGKVGAARTLDEYRSRKHIAFLALTHLDTDGCRRLGLLFLRPLVVDLFLSFHCRRSMCL